MESIDLQKAFEAFSVAIASVVVIATLIGTLRSGAIRSIRFGSFSIEGAILQKDIETIRDTKSKDNTPFETVALAKYYNQVLQRASISFWFSLLFASIGFGVIILAFTSHQGSDTTGTLIKVASGAIIDSVSALFFFQSVNAQKSMADFFEKLRLDRLNAEARELLSEIENGDRRDQLRAQMILKYTGIDALVAGG